MNDLPNANGVGNPLPAAAAQSQDQWRQYCANLLAENERLRAVIDMLKQQRKELLDTFIPGRHKVYDLDEAALLAEAESEPSIQQIIADFTKNLGR